MTDHKIDLTFIDAETWTSLADACAEQSKSCDDKKRDWLRDVALAIRRGCKGKQPRELVTLSPQKSTVELLYDVLSKMGGLTRRQFDAATVFRNCIAEPKARPVESTVTRADVEAALAAEAEMESQTTPEMEAQSCP